MTRKSFRWGVLLFAVGLIALMSSCEADVEGVSRSDRVDGFISDMTNDRYDRLTRHMDPNISGRNSWVAGTWRSALQLGDSDPGAWQLQKQSETRVNIASGNGLTGDGYFTLSYVQRGDDYYFSKITHTAEAGTVTEIAPGTM